MALPPFEAEISLAELVFDFPLVSILSHADGFLPLGSCRIGLPTQVPWVAPSDAKGVQINIWWRACSRYLRGYFLT